MSVTIAIVQPNYLPWLGYFDQMRRADLFVFYDDEQFVRKSWASRNRVRGHDGQPTWLSVAVSHGAGQSDARYLPSFPMLNKAPIDQYWAKRTGHAQKMRQWYRDARYTAEILDEFEQVAHQPYENLADLNIAVIEWMAARLGIHTPTTRSSLLDISLDLDTTARPLAICRHFGANNFLCGPTARAYILESEFTRVGVEIEWHDFINHHPTYTQHREPFMPNLSAMDYLLCNGAGWPTQADN